MAEQDGLKTAPDARTRGTPAVASSGAATGSGSGAAGGGTPEDYDADPKGGGGSLTQPTAGNRPDEGGDASEHGTR